MDPDDGKLPHEIHGQLRHFFANDWPHLSERLARIERAQWALLLMLLSLSVGALVSVLLR
jgi:hypothetical protein